MVEFEYVTANKDKGIREHYLIKRNNSSFVLGSLWKEGPLGDRLWYFIQYSPGFVGSWTLKSILAKMEELNGAL